jgi:hypothetical protein
MKAVQILVGMAICSLSAFCWADKRTTIAPSTTPNQSVSATVYLDFNLTIGKFIFFRVGDGAYPNTSSTVNEVSLTATTSLPSGAINGNSQAFSWDGITTPVINGSNNVSLPVEVRSNAGQINLKTTVTSVLAKDSETIPFSDIKISSSDSNLPAPTIPNSGTSASVNVITGGSTIGGTLVTQRSANWTFSYVPSTTGLSAGIYSGTLTFTASSL